MNSPYATKPHVLVTGADLAPQAVALLGGFELVYAGRTPTEDQLNALCKQYQPVGIIVRYGKISAAIMDASRALRVISKHGAGIDTIDSAAAAARGIAVKAAAGANAAAVAEHTWALILACAKAVPYLNSRVHVGYWDKATHKSIDLKGRCLGLIGLGAIGQRTAEIGMAFGMTVIAYDPFATRVQEGVTLTSIEDLYARSDVISLHCPLTTSNRQMIGPGAIASMRDGVILINTARGGLLDEAAVIAALRSGKIRAAGLDSFAEEPLSAGHAFVDVPNAILSPHIGGVTENAYVDMGVAAAKNLLAIVGGEA